ncbi:MAG: hypothetical protein ACRC5H_05235, partial [Treponemataceae bacterium]
MKKINVLLLSHLICSFLFSISTFSFTFDISIFGVIVSSLFTAILAFSYKKAFYVQLQIEKLPLVRKLLEYHPFVFLIAFILCRAGEKESLHWIDSVSVILWLLSALISVSFLYVINPKRITKLFFSKTFFDADLAQNYQKSYAQYISDTSTKPRG